MLTFIYLLAATGATGNADYTQEPPPLAKTAIELPAAPPSSAPPSPRGSWKRPNPIPKGNPGFWASTNDYPAIALQKELEGTTGFSLAVAPDGRVSNCEIISSSGSPELDQATCMNVTRRARFDPALDERGNAASGTYRNRIRWQIPTVGIMASMPLATDSYPRAPQVVDPLSLRVAREDYPAAALTALQEGFTMFALDIDNTGTVQKCVITTSSGFPALDSQSCALARKWKFDPARNLTGAPTAGKTTHNILWRLPNAPTNPAAFPVPRRMPNLFEKAGTITMTLDFGKDGKLNDCVFEHKGELPIFGSPPGLSENFCKNGMQHGDIKPFLDANGNPQARRVIMKISVDHVDVPVATSKDP